MPRVNPAQKKEMKDLKPAQTTVDQGSIKNLIK